MNQKVTIEVPEKKQIINQYGNRVVVNWCAYARRKIAQQREKKRKEIVVSKITEKDRQMFQAAYRKLMRLRAKSTNPRSKALIKLKSSRSTRTLVRVQSEHKLNDDSFVYCPLIVNKPVTPKPKPAKLKPVKPKPVKPKPKRKPAMKPKTPKPKPAPVKQIPSKVSTKTVKPASVKLSSKKSLPSIKTDILPTQPEPPKNPELPKNPEPPKKPEPMKREKPVVIIPPFKTRPWVPIDLKPKPRIRPVIEYPPLKLRQNPRKPDAKKKEQKTRVRLEKTFYPLTIFSLGKTWHHFKFITPNTQILRGRLSQYSRRFSFRSNGKQSAFIAVVALVTTKMVPMKLWDGDKLDEIISYGDVNYRKHFNRCRRQAVIKPPAIKFKVYTSDAKIFTDIGKTTIKGTFNSESSKDLVSEFEQMFIDFDCLIFTYCDQSYAIWKELKAYYILNSEDCDDTGKRMTKGHGACCVIRAPDSVERIVEYLVGCQKVPNKQYRIYSLKINEKITIKDEMAKLKRKPDPKLEIDESVQVISEEKTTKKDEPVQVDLKPLKSGLAAIVFQQQPELDLGEHFITSSSPPQGFLVCEDYLTKTRDDSRQAPFVSCVAIAMLRLCKSSLWISSTLNEIFQMGREIFAENVGKVLIEREQKHLQLIRLNESIEKKEDENEENSSDESSEMKLKKPKTKFTPQPEPIEKHSDIPITEIYPVVPLKGQKFEIHAENVIFGKVLKRGQDVVSLEDGINLFFKSFDCGLIQGPDVVAIWREKNYFFMLDPTQCGGFKRSFEGKFNSCLSCFSNLNDLVNHYLGNISKEFRHSVFKLAKVDILEHQMKLSDWQNFKGIGSTKWILRGTISDSSEVFREKHRNRQSACMSIAALAKTREVGIQSWKPDTVDEILQIGDELYSFSVSMIKEKDPTTALKPSEIGTELKLDKVFMDLVIDENVLSGTLTETSDNDMTLVKGLTKFFMDDDLCLVTIGDISEAIWKHGDQYYLFSSQSRDHKGRNIKMIDPLKSCSLSESACVLRFMSIEDLVKHVTFNVETEAGSTFSITRVEVIPQLSTSPCLYNYEKFGEEPYGAFLKAYDNYHEDCDLFRSDKTGKTLCNLMACLSFAKILNPHQWNHSDINEILKMGYKLLCNLSTVVDQTSIWQSFEKIEIAAVNLTVDLLKQEKGTFSGRRSFMITAANSVETLQEEVIISEIETKFPRRSVTFSESAVSYAPTLPPLSNELNAESLKTLLNKLESVREAFVVLQSILFDLAIFKMDRLYFVFDPKASDDYGNLVRQRLEDFIKHSMQDERERLYRNMRINDAKRPSWEEEFEELIFGRRVVFSKPLLGPSLNIIAAGIDVDMLPIEISEKGSAYVAWFSNVKLLEDHILSKVPTRFKNESFSLTQFKIQRSALSEDELKPWHSFQAISSNHWILRASISQNDTQFSHLNRNHQDIPNCIMALTFATLCNSSTDWTSAVLDVILKLGDRLYKKSLVKLLKTIENDVPENLKLSLSQIDLPVFIRPFVVSLNDELVKKDSMIKSQDVEPLQTMKQSLIEFFSSSNESLGILSSKDYHVGIWKTDDEAFMMFDPHDIGPDGVKKFTGFACLQRFTDPSDIVEVFYRNIKQLEGFNEYQLVKVSIVKNYFKESNEAGDHQRIDVVDDLCANSKYNLFTATTDVRSIRANELKTVEWTQDNVPLGICYAVASLCRSRSFDSEYYTRDVIDKIILFGNDLMKECAEICFTDFSLCKQALCPDEINWNFELNNAHTNIQMDIFQRGVISTLPCQAPSLMHSIEEFFNFYSVGVLVTKSFVVALWMESGEFFIFYSHPIIENGQIVSLRTDGSLNGFPGLVVFKSVHDLYENIISNINKESFCEPFELRICNLTMTDLRDEHIESPCDLNMERLLNQEIVAPAISANDNELKETIHEEVEHQEQTMLPHDVIEKIKRKKSSATGFIKFPNGSLICGRLSKDSKRFNETCRQFHAGAICLVSVAMSSLTDLNCWCGETIDNVIKSGNGLYVESSVAHKSKEITMSMLNTSLNFCSHQVNLKIKQFREIARENLEREFLIFTLRDLFSCYADGYLCRGWECWTLFKRGKTFYIFDPLGIEMEEKKVPQRRSVLFRFESIEAMIDQLMMSLKDNVRVDDQATCKIGAILSCPTCITPQEKEKIVKPKQRTIREKMSKCVDRETPIMILKTAACESSQEKANCEEAEAEFQDLYEKLCSD